MILKFIFVFAFSSFYTVLRYVIFGPVQASQLPLFLLNKAVALTSIFALFFCAWNSFHASVSGEKFWKRAFAHTVRMHLLVSLVILSKSYYPKFFDGEKMNLMGGLTMLFGIVALYGFQCLGKQKLLSAITIRNISAVFVLAHLVTMGWRGWLDIQAWHGGLPPISLLCCVLVLIAGAIYHAASRKKATSEFNKPGQIGVHSKVD